MLEWDTLTRRHGFFKGAVYAKMNANICGECGYTELIAKDPAALYDACLKPKSSS